MIFPKEEKAVGERREGANDRMQNCGYKRVNANTRLSVQTREVARLDSR